MQRPPAPFPRTLPILGISNFWLGLFFVAYHCTRAERETLQEAKRNVAHLTLSRVARSHLYQAPDDELAGLISLDQNTSESSSPIKGSADEAPRTNKKLQKSQTMAGPPSAMRILSFLRTASMSQTKNLDNIIIPQDEVIDQKPKKFPLKSAKTMSALVLNHIISIFNRILS